MRNKGNVVITGTILEQALCIWKYLQKKKGKYKRILICGKNEQISGSSTLLTQPLHAQNEECFPVHYIYNNETWSHKRCLQGDNSTSQVCK
uniref:Uncharacterized protein n=1 Tax=Arion vulgaris TaxID=1028688 RepID=A0A0B6YZD0_9EUPU